jgi:hypothetical protein
MDFHNNHKELARASLSSMLQVDGTAEGSVVEIQDTDWVVYYNISSRLEDKGQMGCDKECRISF